MLEKVQEILNEHKAEDVRLVDLPDFAFSSHMVVATGTSSRHLWTLAEKLQRAMRDDGLRAGVEGDANSDWIVLDLASVVVHLFTAEKRELYDLEGLWTSGVAEQEGCAEVAVESNS